MSKDPMFKVRLYAALISLVLTAVTMFVGPEIYYAYVGWDGKLSDGQRDWFHISQAVLGFAIAGIVFWRWWKKRQGK